MSVGLILAIWSASNGMSAIINSFNVAYDVEDSRNGIVVKLLSILYTLVLGAVFVVAVVLITLGPVINKFLFGPLGIDNQIEWIFNLVRIVIPLIIIFIIFTVLYSVAPNVKTKLRSVIPGAIFTSIIWLLGRLHSVTIFQTLVTIRNIRKFSWYYHFILMVVYHKLYYYYRC